MTIKMYRIFLSISIFIVSNQMDNAFLTFVVHCSVPTIDILGEIIIFLSG